MESTLNVSFGKENINNNTNIIDCPYPHKQKVPRKRLSANRETMVNLSPLATQSAVSAQKKRKLDALIIEEDISKRKCEEIVEEEFTEVKWIPDWKELQREMHEIGNHVFFEQRIQALMNYMVKVDDTYRLWIFENTEFILETEAYNGNTFHPEEFTHQLGSKNMTCFHLRVYEDLHRDSPLLELQISQGGELAELVWVQAGQAPCLSGNEMLKLYNLLEDTLRFKRVVLLDDANLKVDDKNKIPLRHFYPLSTDDGSAYYKVKVGFEAAICKGLRAPGQDGGTVKITQDPTRYRRAITTMRELTLGTLSEFCDSYSKHHRNLLTRLANTYLGCKPTGSARTIHDLTRAICRVSRDATASGSKRNKALWDLYRWSDLFLTPVVKQKKISAAERTYIKALETIHTTQIFEKRLV